MKCSMYRRFVLFVTNDTNWCRSPNNVLILILSNEIKIQDRERHGDAIKTTSHISCPKECEKFEGESLDHNG